MRGRFSAGVAEQVGCYVYALGDPRTDRIFYVGKGAGNRCFAHVAEARKTNRDLADDYEKLDRIREIEDAGQEVGIELLRHGLSDGEALLVESVVIDVLGGLDDLTNRVTGRDARLQGRMTVEEINARYAMPVTIDSAHRVMLITINRKFRPGMTHAELYEATRKFWRVGPKRRQLGYAHAPQWAMAVYRGVVRGVFRIEGWERPTEADIAEKSTRLGRWAFTGRSDPEMEDRYLNHDVSEYMKSTGNPIHYANL